MKHLALTVICTLLALPAWAFDVGQLMGALAQHKGGRAKFVEKKFIALLDKPVVSSGELLYVAPDRLEKRTLLPKPELLVLDRDTLNIERGKQRYTLRLSEQPEAQAFVESVRGTLAGNRAVLERNYALRLTGNEAHWSLTLLPSDQKIATLVSRITFFGAKGMVQSIEYLLADGDRSVMSIEPVESP